MLDLRLSSVVGYSSEPQKHKSPPPPKSMKHKGGFTPEAKQRDRSLRGEITEWGSGGGGEVEQKGGSKHLELRFSFFWRGDWVSLRYN